MDVGGSMTPYAELVERLFSAASSQISKFKHFYFHNCFYQDLWTDMERNQSVSTAEFLKSEDNDYKLIIVGDAEMSPSELLYKNGAIDYWYHNDIAGLIWMQRFREKFKDSIWLNPLPKKTWGYIRTVDMIKEIFPMFELTLDGLDEGVKFLLGGKNALHNKVNQQAQQINPMYQYR